jgi:hypothetical protein
MRSKYLQKLAATALTTSLGVGAILAGNLDQLNYLNVTGERVAALRDVPANAAIFPSTPWDVVPFIELISPALPSPPPTFIRASGGNPQNSATMIRGFIEPPQTGAYTFWVTGSSDAELWLSTNHTEGGKVRIAFTDGNTGVGEWARRLSQKSAPINLVKGNQYFFELIQKSAGTGGAAEMGWWRPDFTLERPLPIRYAQRFAFQATCIESLCNGSFIAEASVPAPIFNRNPGNNSGSFDNQAIITENRPYDLSPWITSQYPVAFQWQEMVGYNAGQQGSGTPTDIAGDIVSGKYIERANTAQHNLKAFRLKARNVNTGNTSTSRVSQLIVIADSTAPTIASASASGNTNGFNVVFSEEVDPASATAKTNYVVSGGVVVDRVEMRYGETNSNTVVVYTTTAIPGNTTVTVSNVKDRAANANTIIANSVADVLLTDGIISYFAYGAINGGDAIGGTSISDMINATNRFTSLSSSAAQQAFLPFPGKPDINSNRPNIGIQPNVADNYGVLLTGFVVPPQTGLYNIVVSGDDQSIVYISPTSDPAGKVAVAMDPQWNGTGNYTATDRRTMANTGNSGFISSNFPGRPVAANGATIPSNQSKNTYGGTFLTRGNKHFIEVLMKEGGGGDNIDVTWQLPNTWNLANNNGLVNNQPQIPGVYLSQAAAPGQSGPISIVQQPASTGTLENRPVTLSVVHGGSPSFTYQWYKNGIVIPDANARSFTEPLPDPVTEGNAVYTVVIRNLFSQGTSAAATLTVTNDTVGPSLVRAVGSPNFNAVTIWFDEVIDPATAVNAANYSIVKTGTTNQFLAINGNGTLNTPGPGGFTRVTFPTGPQDQGQNYTITVSNVKDIANSANAMTTGTVRFSGWVVSKGFVLYERYFNVPGTSIGELLAAPNYPGSPDISQLLPIMEMPADVGDNYGARMTGFFFPDQDGAWNMYMASDDQGELFLSTDSSPANVTRIAFEPQWGDRRSWTGTSGGRRTEGENNTLGKNLAVMNMAVGQSRYIEARFNEGGGGDYQDVTASRPGQGAPGNGSTSILSGGLIGALANPDETTFTFTTQPQSVTSGEGSTVQLTVAGSGQTLQDKLNNPQTSASAFWQWQRQVPPSTNWTDIAGANGTSYTTAALTPADNLTKYRVLGIIPGLTAPSAEATITVINDTVRPTVTGVSIALAPGSSFGAQNQVRILFSEPMLRAGLQNIANYAVTKASAPAVPLTISAAVAASDNRSVTLTVPAFVSGEQGNVLVTGLVDQALAGNLLDPNPTTKQFSAWTLGNGIRRQLYFNIGGGDLPSLTNNAAFPNSPSEEGFVPLFEEPPSDSNGRPNRENFGTRITGLIVPTVTTNYHFAISGDDNQAFYLSTDANPANRRLVVAEPQWNGYREWTTNDRRVGDNGFFPSVTTLPINRTTSITSTNSPDGSYPLVAGVSYYAELLAKEGGGGDSTAVTWWHAGTTIPAAGTPAIAVDNVRNYLNPDNTINITAQPQNQSVGVGTNATFSVTANPTAPFLGGPVSYQWRRGGVNIGGATGSSYTLAAAAGDNGATFDVVLNAPGAPSVTSTVATLTVGGVVPPPTLAIARSNGTNVVVTYPTTAQAGGHALQKSTALPGGFAPDASGSDVAGTFTTTVNVTAPAAAGQTYWRTAKP